MAALVHSGRAHAPWSASASARLIACAGAFQAAQNVPEPPTNEAAAEGTAAHEIAEECLRRGLDAISFAGTWKRVERFTFEVDDEMVDGVQLYLDTVRALKEPDDDCALLHEIHFRLPGMPIESGGTGDTVCLNFTKRRLTVVDLKYGRGVGVEAKGNAQIRTYMLGALLKFGHADFDEVVGVIVQPRFHHVDGFIRTETLEPAELLVFAGALRRAQTAALAPGALRTAGAHCQFCPAQPTCRVARDVAYGKSMALAGSLFDNLDGGDVSDIFNVPEPKSTLNPAEMTLAEMADVLDHADMMTNFVNAVRARAQMLAEAGCDIPGYELAPRQTRRAWISDDETTAADLEFAGVEEAAIWTPPKLASPAQIEKAIGSKRKKEIAHLWEKKPSGFNLVSKGKTTRSAAQPPALSMFNDLDEE